MSTEIVAVEQSTAPTTIQPLQTVDVQAAEAFMNNYQELVEALLDKSDYQNIQTKDGIKKSKKKSAWRKLATAFNISDDVIEKEIIRCGDVMLSHGFHCDIPDENSKIWDYLNRADKNLYDSRKKRK